MILSFSRFSTALVAAGCLAAPLLAPAQVIYPALGNCPAVRLSGEAVLIAASGDRVIYYDQAAEDDSRGALYLLDGYQPDGAVEIVPDVPDRFRFDIETDELLAYPDGRLIRALTPTDLVPRTVFEAPGDIVALTRWEGAYYVAYEKDRSTDTEIIRVDPLTGQAGPILYTAGFGGIIGMGALDNGVVVAANGPRGDNDTRGERELVRLGATPNTTVRLGTLSVTDPEGNPLRSGGPVTRAGDRLFFFVEEPSAQEIALWTTDGSNGSVEKLGVYDTDPFDRALPPLAFEGELYFFLRELDSPSGQTYQVHRSDGTVAGTETLGDASQDFFLDPYSVTVFDGYLYFTGREGFRRTNASVDGTELVIPETGPIGQLDDASEVVAFNDSLLLSGYANAEPQDFDYELYSSDGTAAGSRLVREFDTRDGENGSPTNFVVAGRRAYFFAAQRAHDQLFVYDLDLATPPYAPLSVDSVTVSEATSDAPNVVTVYASGEGLTYTLGGETNDSGVFDGVPFGTSAFAVTDATGCSVTDSVTVELQGTPVADQPTLAAYRLRANPVAPGAPVGLEATDAASAPLTSIGVFSMDGRRVSVHASPTSAAAPDVRGSYIILGYRRDGLVLARRVLVVE